MRPPLKILLCVSLLVAPASLAAQAGARRAPRVSADPVAVALLPLPDSLRAQATVLGSDGRVLRRGSNGLTCLADRPGDWRLSLVCYPTGVEAFMARGRELSAAGVRSAEWRAILGAEVRSGKWSVPRGTLVRNIAGSIDSTTGRIDSVSVWSEMLLPFVTTDEVGIPESDQGLDPWMMSGGTVNAHVMIRYRTVPWGSDR